MARYEVVAPEESYPAKALRIGAATAGTIEETVGNAPHYLAHGIKSLQSGAEKLGTWATKGLGIENALNLGQEPLEPLSKTIDRVPLESVVPKLGTMAKKAVGKVLPENYLEPKGENEKTYHEFVSDVTSLFTPLGFLKTPTVGKIEGLTDIETPGKAKMGIKGKFGLAKPNMGFGKALGAAALGTLAKWGAQQVGASETGQTAAKVGTVLAATLLGPSGLKKKMGNLYKEADKQAVGKAIDINDIVPELDKLNAVFEKGAMTPSKKYMKDRFNEILSKVVRVDRSYGHREGSRDIRSGVNSLSDIHEALASKKFPLSKFFIPLEDAMELKRNMHEYGRNLKKPEGIEKLLPGLTNSIKKSIDKYGAWNK